MNGWKRLLSYLFAFRLNWIFVCWEYVQNVFSVNALPNWQQTDWLLDKIGKQWRKWFRFFRCSFFFVFFSNKILPFWRSITVIAPNTSQSFNFGHSILNRLILYSNPCWYCTFKVHESARNVQLIFFMHTHIGICLCRSNVVNVYLLRFGKWKKVATHA